MIPMSSSSSHNASRHRSSAAHALRRRPLARSNSSLMGTLKNLVIAPLTWFATAEDFEDSPDLKGKRRRNAAPQSAPPFDESDGPPRTKRARVKSPDTQIQFHPEPQYVPSSYAPPHSAYLDPPEMVFNNPNPFSRSSPLHLAASSLNQFNPSNRSGLTRTMSIDPPTAATPLSREPSMNLPSLDRDTTMEPSLIRSSSSIPRDHSMPLPTTRGPFRLRSSLTPQPALPREVSEPPPLSALAQKPMFVRPPSESHHQRLSSQSSSSTLGSLVESQRHTRSPMRQHSSLLFGSGSHSQDGDSGTAARQPAPAEQALHELDVYRTPLLPTRSRLRGAATSPSDASFPSNISKPVDPSDLFRRRRSSQLLLMRDDRHVSRLGRKTSFGFLEPEELQEKEGKTKTVQANETKPYAGEGGMKKLLARRKKEVEEVEDVEPETSPANKSGEPPAHNESKPEPMQLPPLPSGPSDWKDPLRSQPTSSGSSLRVGRTKTSRNHIARPGRPSRKFSAAFEEDADDAMDDGQELERQKEREALEEAAKQLPAFSVPAGFTFASTPNAKPPIEHDANAKEPPIAALPFSFSKTPVPAEPVAPFAVLAEAPAPIPATKPPSPPFSFQRPADTAASSVFGKATETEKSSSDGIPNFFASSKLVSQASAPSSSLLPPTMSLFGASTSPATPSAESILAPKPKPVPSMALPSTPAPVASSSTPLVSVPTPIKDTDNPFWEGDPSKKLGADSQPSLFSPKMNGTGDSRPVFAKPESASTSVFGGSFFDAGKKEASAPSLFGASGETTFGVSDTEGASTAAVVEVSEIEQQPKPAMSFGSMTGSVATEAEAPKPSPFSFNSTASTAVNETKPFAFGASAPTTNPFASAPAPEPSKANFGFTFGQQQKEPPKSSPATSSPFTFGQPSSTPTNLDAGKTTNTAPFSFGAPLPSAPATTAPFSFGTGIASAEPKSAPSSGGGFTFGTPTVMASTARPVTPPKNDVPEFKMDESPTRDMPVNSEIKPADRPPLGSGFSFGNPSSGSMFGQTAPAASTPFSFNAAPSVPSPNPFASAPADNKPFGSNDFGRPSNTSNPFAFGQNSTPTVSVEPPRPSTTGSFNFQSTTPTTSSGFGFGSGTATSNNPFAPQLSGGSAPNSPSSFTQPFSFGSAAPSQPAPFSFGSSQPASPAGVASSLPQPTTPGGFGAPTTPGGFGTPTSFGAPPSGGSLFTIGAAPPPAPGSGQRVLKKLPRRKN